MTAYLDHAATSPMRASARAAVVEQLARTGNASSLHGSGRAARRVVEESRERIAEALGARPSDVVLTSGGTEADNLALKGLWWARTAHEPGRRAVLVSAVEHHAVLDPADWLATQGAEVVRVPVDGVGRLDVDALDAELAARPGGVALVSVMAANNELGTLQPLADVVARAAVHGVPVHSDAVQAVGHVPVDLAGSGLDLMTVSAHKLGGPVGVGALLARRGLELVPVLHGGGQERRVRSGTLDVAGAAGFAAALEEAVASLAEESARIGALRDALVAGVRRVVPDAVLRGPEPGADRLPGNAHFTFPGCEGDSLLFLLDSHGVEASTGSACQAGVPQPSHVLTACGVPDADARGALRFSLGHTSTRADVDALLAVLPGAVERARAAGLALAAR